MMKITFSAKVSLLGVMVWTIEKRGSKVKWWWLWETNNILPSIVTIKLKREYASKKKKKRERILWCK